MTDDQLRDLYKRHLRGAFVRSGASIGMWTFSLIGLIVSTLKPNNFIGISASVAYLLLINPPALLILRHITRTRSYEYFSLCINQLEIIGYTAIIYFCGGMEATYLTLLYAALIAYVGVVAPRRNSFIVASLCTTTFSLMIGLDYFGVIPHMNVIPGLTPIAVQLIILLVVIALLYVVAYISATTANLLRMNRYKLKQQNIKLEKINEKLKEEIVERRQVENELRESEERYRNILESIDEGYYELDLQGNFTFFNHSLCRILGYPEDDLKGVNSRRYTDTETAEKLDKIYNEAYSKGTPVKRFRYKVTGKDGSTGYVSSSLSLMNDSEGRPIGFRGISRDITELKHAEVARKSMEAQLQYAQRMELIGTLAGGIAHNFNNLLMGIMGYTALMLLEIDADHSNYMSLKNIEELVENGSKLTSQLLGYAREGRYEVKETNLNRLVRETSATIGMTKREITIHQELSETLHNIRADKEQIEQVLMNLYLNAVDAMPGGGDLFLETTNVTDRKITDKRYKVAPGNYVLLTVRDTGAGMDKQTMEHVFEPFFTTKGLARGTGLGLASAYGIVKGHGGYIDFISEKGHGTTFSIYLPATEKEISDKRESSDQLIQEKGTVLLVDDEKMVLNAGEQMLRNLGYEVLLADDGQKAIELYKKNQDKIDIVLLDMVMPSMGGGETFDRIKEINDKAKVLLLSGYSIEGEATKILERGCDAFIQKPFNLDQLSRKLREVSDMN